MQLADSFFPSGIFGMSSGLESYFKHGYVNSSTQVLKFIELQIKNQVLPYDCVFLNKAMNAAKIKDVSELTNLDKKYYSMKLVKEVRNSSVRMGSQMLNCITHTTSNEDKAGLTKVFQDRIEAKETPGTHPICLGLAAYFFDIPNKSAIKLMLYSYSVSIVGAAVRLAIIQHFDGQKILTMLAPMINSSHENVVHNFIDDTWQLAPLTEILQMKHEQDDLRMFLT